MFRSAIGTGFSFPEVLIGVPGWFNEFLMTYGTLFYVQSFFNVEFHSSPRNLYFLPFSVDPLNKITLSGKVFISKHVVKII